MPKISLPSVTSPLPPDMRAFVQRVREAFMAIGSAAITRDELEGANLISVTSSGQVVPGSAIGESGVVIDYTPPPAPTNLSAYGAVTTIILEWDEPLYANHAFTEVWRSTSDNLGTAVKVGSTDSFLYADPLGDSGITYYYWVRFVSSADVVGPYNGVAGTSAETGKAGPNNIAELAVGTAHLANLSVVEGKIADLAVTNAKFGGYLQSNNYVPGTSGWHINKDGTIEISSATVRGGVWAGSISSTAGVTVGVGGNIKGGATAFGTGTGFWMGYDSGAYKFRIGTPGSSRAEWNGSAFNIYDGAGNLTISSGVVDWEKVGGANKPANNATVGADSSNLRVGVAGNLVFNGHYADGLAGTVVGWRSGGNQHTLGLNLGGAGQYQVAGEGTAYITQPGANASGVVFDANIWNGVSGQWFAITPGAKYEVYAYLSTFRCVGRISLLFHDAAGTQLLEVIGNEVNGPSSNINSIANMTLSRAVGTAPANATKAYIIIRGINNGQNDPYVFFSRVYLGFAGSGQTEVTPWSAGRGISQITSSNVSTYIANAAIGNAQIAYAAIQRAQIMDGEITTAKIGALQVTQANIQDLSVGGEKITHPTTGYFSVTTGSPEVTIYTGLSRRALVTLVTGALAYPGCFVIANEAGYFKIRLNTTWYSSTSGNYVYL